MQMKSSGGRVAWDIPEPTTIQSLSAKPRRARLFLADSTAVVSGML